MLYPTNDIDEIMPDALIDEIDEKMSSDFKNCISYFTGNKELAKKSNSKNQSKQLKKNFPDPVNEGRKGVLPDNVFMHPDISYSYKYGNVILNGLDNSIELENEIAKD